MYSFPYLDPVCCPMSNSNCFFLTCIQISQEAGQVVWYSYLFQNFPVYCDLHSQSLSHSQLSRCFSGISLLSLWSSECWQFDFWFLLPFLNTAYIAGNSWLMYCWSLVWRNLSITLLVCRMSAIAWLFEHSLALPFFRIGMKTDFFSPAATAEFSTFASILSAAL